MNKKYFFSRDGFSPVAILLAVLVIIVGGVALFVLKISPNGADTLYSSSPMMDGSEKMMGGVDEKMMGVSDNGTTYGKNGMMGGSSMMGAPGGEVFVFPMTAKNYSFGPAEIRVKKGSMVRVELSIEEGFHDWVLDEFGARTPQSGAGKTVTAEFVADRAGVFEYYCSVGKHRELGMIGKLIVE